MTCLLACDHNSSTELNLLHYAISSQYTVWVTSCTWIQLFLIQGTCMAHKLVRTSPKYASWAKKFTNVHVEITCQGLLHFEVFTFQVSYLSIPDSNCFNCIWPLTSVWARSEISGCMSTVLALLWHLIHKYKFKCTIQNKICTSIM